MKRVLIVDDEERLLKSIEIGLQSYKDQFEVITARNGKEAIDVLTDKFIDLVITDLQMPEMDGFELLAYLSAVYPFLPTFVMTAFTTPDVETRLNNTGPHKLLEKPIDFNRLTTAITEGLQLEEKEGALAGFSLANFLQLLAMEQKTCLLNVTNRDKDGYLYLEQGELKAAVCGKTRGVDAFYELLTCENMKITFKKIPTKKIPTMIKKPLMQLLMEGMQRIDENKAEQSSETEDFADDAPAVKSPLPEEVLEDDSDELHDIPPGKEENTTQKGDINMAKLEQILEKLADIDGFLAAGVFTPNGEIAAQINKTNMHLPEIGSIANDVLLKAQKATDIMEIGRGNVVHVESPKAHVFVRCYNENTDFSQTQTGKVHVHLVLLMEPEANLALGKMKMESVMGEVAAYFR